MSFYSAMAQYYDTIFPFREAVGRFLEQRLPPSGRILDLGCGTGEYCAHLQTPQRSCLGVDLDPAMIAEAGRRHPAVEFRPLALEQVASLPAGAFAGAFCIGNVLAHLPGAGLPAFLQALHGRLGPGAPWIVQIVNFHPLDGCGQHDFPPREFPDQGLTFQRRYTRGENGEYLFKTRLLRRGQTVFTGVTPLHFHLTEPLVELHHRAGFVLVEQAGDFAGAPFDPATSPGNILVFQRRETVS